MLAHHGRQPGGLLELAAAHEDDALVACNAQLLERVRPRQLLGDRLAARLRRRCIVSAAHGHDFSMGICHNLPQ